MAKLRDLTAAVAEVLGLDGGLVGGYARKAREEGLVAAGGRGAGARDVSSSDAVNLLLAACCADQARDVPAVVRTFRDLGCSRAIWKGRAVGGPDEREIWPVLTCLDPEVSPTLGAALEGLVEAAAAGALQSFLNDLPESYFSYFPDPALQAFGARGGCLFGDLGLEFTLHALKVTLRVGVGYAGSREGSEELQQILPLVLCYYGGDGLPDRPPFNRRGDRRITVRLSRRSILALGQCLGAE